MVLRLQRVLGLKGALRPVVRAEMLQVSDPPACLLNLPLPATPACPCSGQFVDAEAARAKYDEISAMEKPNFPDGEKSVNEMVSSRYWPCQGQGSGSGCSCSGGQLSF